MERATREFETPSGKKVVVNTYLTGREYEYTQSPMLKAMTVRAQAGAEAGSGVSFGDIDVDKVTEASHRLIEKLVVSVDGVTENTLEVVLDLPNEDYQHILGEIQDLDSKKN